MAVRTRRLMLRRGLGPARPGRRWSTRTRTARGRGRRAGPARVPGRSPRKCRAPGAQSVHCSTPPLVPIAVSPRVQHRAGSAGHLQGVSRVIAAAACLLRTVTPVGAAGAEGSSRCPRGCRFCCPSGPGTDPISSPMRSGRRSTRRPAARTRSSSCVTGRCPLRWPSGSRSSRRPAPCRWTWWNWSATWGSVRPSTPGSPPAATTWSPAWTPTTSACRTASPCSCRSSSRVSTSSAPASSSSPTTRTTSSPPGACRPNPRRSGGGPGSRPRSTIRPSCTGGRSSRASADTPTSRRWRTTCSGRS